MASGLSIKRGIFISHITEEHAVALELQRHLKRTFGEDLSVFVSPGSIDAGSSWWNDVRDSVISARVVLVLLSPQSVTREWINYEAGVGDGAGAHVIPIAIGGYSFDQTDSPLKTFQGRHLEEYDKIFADIAKLMERPAACLEEKQYARDMEVAVNQIVRRGVTLEPFIEVRDASTTLKFRVSNTGTRDVELIEIEAAVPQDLLARPDWRPGPYPVIRSDDQVTNGRSYLRLIEKAYAGHLDPIRTAERNACRLCSVEIWPHECWNFCFFR